MEFFSRFGEVARVVRHLGGSADDNARRVYELYKRHAEEVVRVVDAGLAEHVSQIRTRTLPESCLLRLVHDPSVPAAWTNETTPATDTRDGAATATASDYYLRQQAQKWEIRFEGHEPQCLNTAIGYVYLRELLRFPDKRFTVSELLVSAHGDKAALPKGVGERGSDVLAKKAYAQRLQELDEELEEAREFNDLGNVERLAGEREKLLTEFRAAGFQGNAKRHNKDLNNIRNSVCNAIKRALLTIGRYDRAASDHLSENIERGFSVVY